MPDPSESVAVATRRLIDALRRAPEIPADTAASLVARIDEAAEALEPLRAEGPYQQSGFADHPIEAFSGSPRIWFPYSPVLGHRNPLSPPIDLEIVPRGDRADVAADLELGPAYCGPPGFVHGGVIALIFDEVLGCANIANNVAGMTGTLSIRYERPTPIEQPLRVEGRIDRIDGRKVFAAGELTCEGTVCARAEGIFLRHITDDG